MNKEIKSLYRLYRPKTFAEVIGQEHITKTLQNQIAAGKVGHAYLFCGTRGTGKTSVAKIFARAVNGIKEDSQSFDIFEIDAASNNSVQDVRDLIEKVKYPPVNSKYKVYIVDEIHMFSGSAFNAFLKTLEEPPSHVIFILCTTEPHKLLPTVQSRCLRFDFRTVSAGNIEKLISAIFKKENITATPEAVKMLAEGGCGSVRDALSLAETVISFTGDKTLTDKDVCEVLGTVDESILKILLESITAGDAEKIIKTVKSIFEKGINTLTLCKRFLEVIKETFLRTKKSGLLEYYKIFAELEINIKTAQDAQSMFEGACLVCMTVHKPGQPS